MNIKDPETERLAAEVAALTGDTKTGAIRAALRDRRDRLTAAAGAQRSRSSRLHRFLVDEAWPQIPPDAFSMELTKADRERILGYGPDGV